MAAKAGDSFDFRHAGFQMNSDLARQSDAQPVTLCIVDWPEVVAIERDRCAMPAAPLARRQGRREAIRRLEIQLASRVRGSSKGARQTGFCGRLRQLILRGMPRSPTMRLCTPRSGFE